MDFIIKGRQEGKTEALVKWVADAPQGTHRVIVCARKDQAEHLAKTRIFDALQLPLRFTEHVTWPSALMNGSFDRDVRLLGRRVEYAIDDIGDVLYQFIGLRGGNIELVAGTGRVV